MNRFFFLILFFLNSFWSNGQINNRWQPDSIYKNRNVKKIYVYQNSLKDLSEIVELNRNGKRIRIEKYSASYDRRTRNLKTIDRLTHHIYDSTGRLTQEIDTILYRHNNSVGTERTIYLYKDDLLVSSKYFTGKFEEPNSETFYTHKPFTSTTIKNADTLVIYRKTMEYDKDFYVKRFYGFVLEPKLKKVQDTIDGKIETIAYSDEKDRQRFDDNEIVLNHFNEKNQLVKSEIKSVFMNDRVFECNLTYKYNKIGLLKSIRGYVPLYFKYEYFE